LAGNASLLPLFAAAGEREQDNDQDNKGIKRAILLIAIKEEHVT
jgi:hypothetical protein